MALSNTLVLFLFSLPSLVRASTTCGSSYPIYVDIHRREVNGSLDEIEDFVYGSFIGVGIPHQNQSLWPSILHNETYFAASDFCNGVDSKFNCYANSTGGSITVANDTT